MTASIYIDDRVLRSCPISLNGLLLGLPLDPDKRAIPSDEYRLGNFTNTNQDEEFVESFGYYPESDIGVRIGTNAINPVILDRDRPHIAFALREVIENAIHSFDGWNRFGEPWYFPRRFPPGDKRIEINATENGEYLEVVVEDNGKGIPAEAMPFIGNFGYTPKGNIGQGLFIARNHLQEGYNGQIVIESAGLANYGMRTVPAHKVETMVMLDSMNRFDGGDGMKCKPSLCRLSEGEIETFEGTRVTMRFKPQSMAA